MEQEIFNWAIAIAGCLGGWVLKTIWDSVKDLQTSDKEITNRVSEIEKLVAGNYITRDELERITLRMFDKLDSISEKLNNNVDR